MSIDYGYTFRHRRLGYNVIAQSWTHFFKLQADEDYFQLDYQRFGTRHFKTMRLSTEFRKLEKEINNFFEPLAEYTRVGHIITGIQIGDQFSAIQLFLKYLHNHACMMGDRELLFKVNNAKRVFRYNEELCRHALPPHND